MVESLLFWIRCPQIETCRPCLVGILTGFLFAISWVSGIFLRFPVDFRLNGSLGVLNFDTQDPSRDNGAKENSPTPSEPMPISGEYPDDCPGGKK